MNLQIEKFEPKKQELDLLAKKYSGLTINGIEDKEGYQIVQSARVELKKIRVQIQKTGKELRAEALTFQKAVIAKEKEYIGIIEPIEIDLENKQKAINDEKEKILRVSLLPARKELLSKIEIELTDEELLEMDVDKFNSFLSEKQTIYFEEKERMIREKEEKIEADKRKAEEEVKRAKEIEEAKKEAEEKAKRDFEAKIQAEKLAEDKKRIEEEVKKKMEENAKIEEQKKLEAKKKYQNFLTKHGYSEDTKEDFKIERNGQTVTLYKKIGEINV